MKTCHCEDSGNLNNGKCDNVHHIEALNGRAAAFEAMGDLDRATRDAERILELAPELPDVSSPGRAAETIEALAPFAD
ncbi:hypothetical protein E4U11_004397 [Claviceps purpurea]|nr:hypothetical protein E4U11_004397 [Claviceps purpurea]